MNPLTGIAARVFDALCEHPYGLTMPELIPLVYTNPDREPDWASDIIRRSAWRANKMLRNIGLPLRMSGGYGIPGSRRRWQIYIRKP